MRILMDEKDNWKMVDTFMCRKMMLRGNKCRGRGNSHVKRGGMLVVSLRGVNFGFWSHLGCSGQNAIICSREGLL